jgi:hypothetical protein
MRREYGTRPATEIAELLGRTVGAIRQRALILGLKGWMVREPKISRPEPEDGSVPSVAIALPEPRPFQDEELWAMAMSANVIEPLAPAARRRVIRWLCDRYDID